MRTSVRETGLPALLIRLVLGDTILEDGVAFSSVLVSCRTSPRASGTRGPKSRRRFWLHGNHFRSLGDCYYLARGERQIGNLPAFLVSDAHIGKRKEVKDLKLGVTLRPSCRST